MDQQPCTIYIYIYIHSIYPSAKAQCTTQKQKRLTQNSEPESPIVGDLQRAFKACGN